MTLPVAVKFVVVPFASCKLVPVAEPKPSPVKNADTKLANCAYKFVLVEFVKVAFVATILFVFVVEELVVEAFKVAKFPLLPQIFVKFAVKPESKFEK